MSSKRGVHGSVIVIQYLCRRSAGGSSQFKTLPDQALRIPSSERNQNLALLIEKKELCSFCLLLELHFSFLVEYYYTCQRCIYLCQQMQGEAFVMPGIEGMDVSGTFCLKQLQEASESLCKPGMPPKMHNEAPWD